MDLVLVISAQSRPFVERLAQFLMEYRYEAEELTLDNGTRKVRMYRFNAAAPNGMPPQIELLGPDNDTLRHAAEQYKIPVKLGTEYSGLSRIIQNLLRSLNATIPGLDLDEAELRRQLDALLTLFPITG